MIDFSKLIPVVTQDYKTKHVLMLAFVNKKAFETTLKTGYATYYSRSRNKLWIKGSTSGNYLKIKEIRINCNKDSLLFLVEVIGKGVCHVKNNKSCYFRKIWP